MQKVVILESLYKKENKEKNILLKMKFWIGFHKFVKLSNMRKIKKLSIEILSQKTY